MKSKEVKITNCFVHETATWSGLPTPGGSVLFTSWSLGLFLCSPFSCPLSEWGCAHWQIQMVWPAVSSRLSYASVLKGTSFFTKRVNTGFKSFQAMPHSRDHSMWSTRCTNCIALILQDVGHPHPLGHPRVWFGVFTGYAEIHGKEANVWPDSETLFCRDLILLILIRLLLYEIKASWSHTQFSCIRIQMITNWMLRNNTHLPLTLL